MSEKNGLVKNASFLMMATLISRVIGLLYRSPLGVVLGTVGLGYYGYANNVYVILLLISAYSIPMAVSKVVSERLALKQYRNAQKVFHGALLYAMIVGGVAALVAFFFGNYLLPVNQQQALLALRMLAPTIFFSAILGVMRGYFQAHSTMMPASISQILEQIANAIVSILAAWLLIKKFAVDEETHAIYGGEESGDLSFPDLSRLAPAYGFAYKECRNSATLEEDLRAVMEVPAPVICQVFVSKLQKTEPKLASRQLPDGTMVSASLEDMYPFLSREEMEEEGVLWKE